MKTLSRRRMLPLATLTAGALVPAGCSAGDVVGGGGDGGTTLSFLVDSGEEPSQ